MRPCLPAVALVLALAACTGSAPPVAPVRADAATPAPSVPAATARDTARPTLALDALDGTRLDLAAERGRWVVVNFWATWCAPCLKEMPELDALDRRRDDVRVFGLAYEDIDAAGMRAFLAQRPVAYPIAIIDTYAPPADFDTPRGLPTTHLIAPDGRLTRSFAGPVTAAELEEAMAAHGEASTR